MAQTWPLITADWNFWPDGLEGEQTFAAARDLGFSGVELGVYASNVELSPSRRAEILRWKASYGLSVPAVLFSLPPRRWPYGCLVSPDQRVRQRVIDEAAAIGSAAKELGAQLLGIWLGGDRVAVVEDYPKAWGWLLDGVREICAAAAASHLQVALEYKPREVVGNADAFLRLAEAVRADNLGLLLDTGHAIYGGEELTGVLKMCRSRLVHIHLDDNYGDCDRDLPPGAVHNFAPFFEALAASSYDGPLGFDLYYAAAEEGWVGSEACRQGKQYVERLLAHLPPR